MHLYVDKVLWSIGCSYTDTWTVLNPCNDLFATEWFVSFLFFDVGPSKEILRSTTVKETIIYHACPEGRASRWYGWIQSCRSYFANSAVNENPKGWHYTLVSWFKSLRMKYVRNFCITCVYASRQNLLLPSDHPKVAADCCNRKNRQLINAGKPLGKTFFSQELPIIHASYTVSGP